MNKLDFFITDLMILRQNTIILWRSTKFQSYVHSHQIQDRVLQKLKGKTFLPKIWKHYALYFFRWYYLAKVDDCIQFPWGGCQGNENNFLSQAQCRAACQASSVDSSVTSTLSSSSVLSSPLVSVPPSPSLTKYCSLPPDSGPCQDRIVRYYFDPSTLKCQKWEKIH